MTKLTRLLPPVIRACERTGFVSSFPFLCVRRQSGLAATTYASTSASPRSYSRVSSCKHQKTDKCISHLTFSHTSNGALRSRTSGPFQSHHRHFHCLSAWTLDRNVQSLDTVPRRQLTQDTYDRWFSPDVAPFTYAQNLLETVHDSTGLPWWASIMLTTFALRTFVTFPFAVYSQYIMARIELLQPEMKELAKELGMETSRAVKMFNWSENKAKARFHYSMKKIVRSLYIRDNCHPFKVTVVAWIQLPLWVSISISLRNMSGGWIVNNQNTEVLSPGLTSEGLLWFPDLTLADTTFILPVIMGLTNLAIIEMQTLRAGERSKLQRYLTNALRGLSLVMVPIGAIVPSSMCWYWFSSSLVGLSQNIMLKFPAVRRLVRLPKVPSESTTPFKDMAELARVRYGRKQPQK